MGDHDDGIPRELKEKLAKFDAHLSDLEAGLEPLLSINRGEIAQKLESVDQAKVDLVAAYAVNSLFWMYLNVNGVNPKEHAVKQELARIQSYMLRVKEVEEKKKAPKLNKEASKRFMRSALWQAAQKKGQGSTNAASQPSPGASSGSQQQERGSKGKSNKRRRDER